MGNMSATIHKLIDCHRRVLGRSSARSALHIELGLADSGNIALDESRFAPVVPTHVHVNLIGIRYVAPDTLMRNRSHALRSASEDAKDPVNVMRSPVVDRATRERLVTVPPATGMFERSDECLHIEDVTKKSRVDCATKSEEVAIPAPVLMNRDCLTDFGRNGKQLLGIGDGEAHWLLDNDMLASPQEFKSDRRVEHRRCGDDDDIDIVSRAQRGEIHVTLHGRKVGHRGQAAFVIRIADADECESIGFGRGETMGIPHATKRSVTHDADADCVRRRGTTGRQPIEIAPDLGCRCQTFGRDRAHQNPAAGGLTFND